MSVARAGYLADGIGAPPRTGSRWRMAGAVVAGLLIASVAGALPLEIMLGALGGAALFVGMLLSPMLGLYALLVSIPFSPTFGLEDAAFSISIFEPLAFLLTTIWLARGVLRREIVLPRTSLFGGLIALLAVLLFTSGNATSFPLALKETLKWVLLVLAFVFTSVNAREERTIRAVLAALFVAGAAQAVVGIVQFVAGIGPPAFAIGGFMRAHGNFGQPNPFAGYLGTILPLALAMALIQHPGRFRALAWSTVGLTGLAIALSLSRGAWLGLAISLGVMALAWSSTTKRLVIPSAVLGALSIVLAQFGLLPATLGNRITSVTDNFGVFDVRAVTLTPDNFAVVERMAHWQAGWEMFLDHPFFGVGPGNYPALYEDYYIAPWQDALGHAHNYYLNMAAETGVPGLLALLLVLLLAFRTLRHSIAAATARPGVRETGTIAPGPRTGGRHGDGRRGSGLRLVGLFGGGRGDAPRAPAVISAPFARALAIGLLGSLTMFSTHNMFDNLLVHGVGIQIGILLGLIGSTSLEASQVSD
ncbi:MAG: O-antigen ligase family protein [Chloroflexi bacterium]|nr:O-antigen ligase family protein [Chloroflexota bacterium]